jgi:hypothetical protein
MAAEIFFDTAGTLEQKPGIYNQQTNFIQINGAMIT